MGDLVSLGKARKAKARAEKETLAEANRARFGRTKAEKAKDAIEKGRAQALLDGHRRDDE
jgi:hypothetical protein